MRLFLHLVLLLIVPFVGCAEFDPADDGPATEFDVVRVACRTDVDKTFVSILDWELGVSAEPIEAGKPFSATLDGVALFPEWFLDDGQELIPGGVEEVNLVEFSATVHVRSGALGTDVILESEPIPYSCSFDKRACDPANDVLGDPPKAPGLRGNTDCEPVSAANPCGRFIRLPISNDCTPGGVCAEKDKLGQCDLNEFCIIEDLRFPLQEAHGQYTANVRGDVLFGWDDESTGATVRDDPEDPNFGTWILPPAVYEEPLGPIGIRLTVGNFPVAVECTMGVDCKDPDLGTGCQDFVSSPTPDQALISLPIETGNAVMSPGWSP